MKPSKKNKTQLIYKLIMNVILFIGYFFFSLNYLSGYFDDLTSNKELLIEKNNLRDSLLSEGISYSSFKSKLSEVTDKKDYGFKILSKIDKEFYNTNISNGSVETFETFFSDKEKKILEKENSSEIKTRSNKIDKILPFYVDGIDIGENNITDFEFINYVETLIESFSLSTSDSIGINRVEKVIDGVEGSNSLDSSLFFIPLKLKLQGSKKNVLDFIYYLQNIGNIDIIKDELKIYSDKKFHKTLLGDKHTSNYNVFKKQIVSIEGISFDNYIDSSIKIRGNGKFIDFIKNDQGREKIGFVVDLRFYVRGISTLKIDEKINFVIQKYNILSKTLKKKLTDVNKKSFLIKGSKAISIRNSIRSYTNNIESMSAFFQKGIKKKKKDKDKIYELYKEILEYESGFVSIENNLKLIDEKIKKLDN